MQQTDQNESLDRDPDWKWDQEWDRDREQDREWDRFPVPRLVPVTGPGPVPVSFDPDDVSRSLSW